MGERDLSAFVPQMLAVLVIAVGGTVGMKAAVDTGDLLRYLGTAVFLVISLGLYIWGFHVHAARVR